MRFSILLEVQISDPTPADEQRAFRETIEQIELADALGYHCAWVVEHHGLYEYAHSSAPEIILAYAAARTRRIRLGHGVTLTPQRYNHPIRVAERVATLDILSGGRINWGSGKSGSRTEQEAFGVEAEDLHGQWLEALEMIPRMWQSDVFSWEGRFYRVPPTQIIPRPVQAPHPPIYVACSAPERVVEAGRLGAGALNFAHGKDHMLSQKIEAYRRAVADAAPTAYQKNNHFAVTASALVLRDDAEACAYGFRGARFFSQCIARYYFDGTRPIGRLPIDRDPLPPEDLERHVAERDDAEADLLAVIGDPFAAREAVRRFMDTGADELILIMQLGTVPHEMVLRSLRLFAEEVMSRVA